MLRIGILLVHERDASETALQCGDEVLIRQIAFQANALFAFAVEKKYSRGPYGFKAMEPRGMFFDVSFHGQKILVNEFGGLLVFV